MQLNLYRTLVIQAGKNVTYFDGSKSTSPTGQLNSKGLFDAIFWTKKPTQFFLRISALASKKRYQKIRALYISYWGLFKNIII